MDRWRPKTDANGRNSEVLQVFFKVLQVLHVFSSFGGSFLRVRRLQEAFGSFFGTLIATRQPHAMCRTSISR